MLEEILDIRNVQKAFRQVTANKGAGGIDGMQTDELRDYLNANWQTMRTDILEGNYCPQAVRKVEIPKAEGGTGMLGIPTVTDRLLQQAIAQWPGPKYEEEFSNYSYGYREGRNAHQAVLQAQSNLNELDKELQARGHRFVRYADDCSIYVRSEKSAQRVLETITGYIESKLKLKVNRSKSKVSRPTESTLLGFSFHKSGGKWQISIAPKSVKKIQKKMKEKTRRSDPSGAKEKIKKMEAVIRGWVNYFAIAKAKSRMEQLDELVRKRLRIGIWKQWKRPKTRRMNLIKPGIRTGKAYEWSNSRKGYCRIAHSPVLHGTLNIEYFARLGYVGFAHYYYWKTEHQLKLLF